MTNPNAAIFSAMFSDMAKVFTDLWGDSFEFELVDGRKIICAAIFVPIHEERQITDYGVSQSVSFPRLDIRREDLTLNFVFDPEADMDGAIVTIGNKTYTLTEPRDDHRVMLKCRLALSSE